MPQIITEEGILSDLGYITEAVEDYYSRFFAKRLVYQIQMAEVLGHLSSHLSPEQWEHLKELVSLEELSFAVIK